MKSRSTKKLNSFFVAVLLLLFGVFCALSTPSQAAFNPKVNYQGKLLDATSAPVADGTYSMVFRLYTVPSGGSNIWTETQSVSVQSGLFSVMLGTTTSLASVDFNQTLYLGINVASDGEMTPRKVLGAVPAAFEADNAATVGGVASTSFVRSDAADTMAASTASTLLTITQSGTGDILNLFDGGTEVFTVLDGGNVGIGTSTPGHKLTVAGAMHLTGALRDRNNSAGTNGYVLQSNGSGTQWVATSSLGFISSASNSITPNQVYTTGQADEYCLTYEATGTTWEWQTCGAGGLTTADIDTSAELAAILTDETGSGRAVFSTSPAFSGTTTFAALTATSTLTMSGTAANIALGSNYLSGDGQDEGIYVNSSGSVGVGTTTVPSLLNIAGTFRVGTGTLPTLFARTQNYFVGIGTTTPYAAEALKVAGNVSIGNNYINNDGDTAVGLSFDTAGRSTFTSLSGALTQNWYRNTSSASGSGFQFVFEANTSGVDMASIQSVVDGSTSNGYLSFSTRGSNTIAERMRLTSTGNFGLGTTTANQALSIYRAAADAAIEFSTVSGSAEKWTIGIDDSDGAKFKISSSSALGTSDRLTINGSGYVGIGTTTPTQLLSVAGNARLTGALYDRNNSAGTSGYVLQSNGSGTQWVATSSLNTNPFGASVGPTELQSTDFGDFTCNGTSCALDADTVADSEIDYANVTLSDFTNDAGFLTDILGESIDDLSDVTLTTPASGHVLSYNGSAWVNTATSSLGLLSRTSIDTSAELAAILTDETGSGRAVFSTSPAFSGTATFAALTATSTLTMSGTAANIALGSNYLSGDGQDEGIYIDGSGNVGIGTTTQGSTLAIQKLSVTGNATAGFDRFYGFANGTASAIQYGDKAYIKTTNTATTTIVGSMLRLEDSTTYGNTIRGLEVQTTRGNNTKGENTAIAGFGRTFGVRGTTEGDAGASFEPAGGFFQTKGTTQGNAVRGYSASITTATLLSLFQDTSTFAGTGLEMNFGNTGGSFSSSTASRFLDLQNAGTSKFIVYGDGRASIIGTTTIGVGGTSQRAGLQIGYGGLCVDNDGTCNASTTGRITSVSSATGNSDLAEMYFSSQTLEPGEVVVSDGFLSIRRATGAADEQVLGVVSTKPGLLLGFDDTPLAGGQKGYPLALTGRVPVQLSDENGSVAVGDPLTLSSVPGIVMKATGASQIVGYALEAFNGSKAYTEGYINQFGDDLAAPMAAAEIKNADERTQDGCFYGAGGEAGSPTEDCIPTVLPQEEAETYDEAAALATFSAEQRALTRLRSQPAATRTTAGGASVRVGNVTMFVKHGYYQLATQTDILNELISTSSDSLSNSTNSSETIWTRIKSLAQNFVDGVLTIAGLKTEKVETRELCVDGVCVNGDDLRALLNGNQGANASDSSSNGTGSGENTSTDNSNDTQPGEGGGLTDSVPLDVPENEATSGPMDNPSESTESVVVEPISETPEPETVADTPDNASSVETLPEAATAGG